jgi:hypothetical protein
MEKAGALRSGPVPWRSLYQSIASREGFELLYLLLAKNSSRALSWSSVISEVLAATPTSKVLRSGRLSNVLAVAGDHVVFVGDDHVVTSAAVNYVDAARRLVFGGIDEVVVWAAS